MQELLRSELSMDERIVWSDIPKQGIMLRGPDAIMIPFSIMWCGFAIFWEIAVLTTEAPFFFKLWGIPFVLVGLHLVFGRFFFDSKKRAGTIYGLTNTRAIIISSVFSKKVTSINLKNLSELNVKVEADGSGTITLGATNPMQAFNATGIPGSRQVTPAFEGIKDVQKVKQLIYQYQNL